MSVQYYYYLVLGFNIMFQLPKMGSSTIFSLMDPICAMMKMFVHEWKKELLTILLSIYSRKVFFFCTYTYQIESYSTPGGFTVNIWAPASAESHLMTHTSLPGDKRKICGLVLVLVRMKETQ